MSGPSYNTVFPIFYPSTSGNPATLVNNDKTPANADADNTIIQLTSPITAAVPIVATAVCATVLMALIPALLIHSIQYSLLLIFLILLFFMWLCWKSH